MNWFSGVEGGEIMRAILTAKGHVSQFQAVVEFRDFEYATVATGSS